MGILLIVLAALGVVGWLWTTVVAFQAGDTVWGLCCLFIPIVCLVYGFFNLDELKVPFGMLCVSLVGRIAIVLVAVSSS